ncbi:MAG: preprotein translocase subunit SecE [Povalibacter sp.]
MTEQVQQQSATALDAAKLAAGVLIVAGGVAAFYLLSAQPIWLRWIIVLAGLIVGALVSLQSFQGKTFWAFVQSSRVELRKVVWPNRQETIQVTIVVIVMVVVLSLFFWGLDSLLGFVTRWLTGNGE